MLKKIVGTIWRKLTPSLRMKIVWLTQKEFTVSAAAIVVNKKREVLLLDHVFRSTAGWGIPGGFIDYGEQPEEAVRRELREETGIELSDVRLLSVRTINSHLEILFYAESDGSASVKSLEINAVRWFKISEMPENMTRIEKSAIEKLFKDSL